MYFVCVWGCVCVCVFCKVGLLVVWWGKGTGERKGKREREKE